MTKAEYLSNSAKLFSINGIILFVANAFIFAGKINSDLGAYGTKFSNYTFYIIAILCFLSLNGEGVGYKRHRDFGNKKKTIALKIAKWIIWYLAIIALIFAFDYSDNFSIIHYIGLAIAIPLIDTAYLKRRVLTQENKND